MAEYNMMLNTIELKPGVAEATADEISKDLTMHLGEISQGMSKATESFQGGGWEVVSHALTRIDSHLILSFLIRRDKKRINPS